MSTNPHFSLRELLENPDLLVTPVKNSNNDEKLKNIEDDSNFDFSAAFLGPVLWEKTLPFDEEDFKLESLGLQEFFDENDLLPANNHPVVPQPVSQPLPQPSSSTKQYTQHTPVTQPVPSNPPPAEESVPEPSQTYQASIGEEDDITLVTIPGQEGFDPRKRRFTEEELKPQPMIKKSKKVYVPDGLKDDAYWGRRNKNNMAAKRSRDARRVKENQIAMRAAFLEKENGTLKSEMEKVQLENIVLKKRLSQYEVQAKLNGTSL